MIREDLKYTEDHEWMKVNDGVVTIGITDYAQGQLGDVVYVELPEIGSQVTQFETCGTIESVKTVSDLCSPISGEVVKINEELDDTPELINTDPYEAGWIFEVKVANPHEFEQLLSPQDYEALIKGKEDNHSNGDCCS